MSISFQIRVRGRITERTRRSLADYSVHQDEVDTAMTGTFQDEAEFKGFIARLEDLGLDVVDLRRLPGEAGT